ncbi:hypothetical protein BU15DRAFT_63818 [Melanogaster broomeanus]|nr:hypothetical protein BU15DRAFT_63818 [Melanogaster broomeanus]
MRGVGDELQEGVENNAESNGTEGRPVRGDTNIGHVVSNGESKSRSEESGGYDPSLQYTVPDNTVVLWASRLSRDLHRTNPTFRFVDSSNALTFSLFNPASESYNLMLDIIFNLSFTSLTCGDTFQIFVLNLVGMKRDKTARIGAVVKAMSYKGHQLPIKLPLAVFPEVGDAITYLQVMWPTVCYRRVLGSGCGAVLMRFIERAFLYAALAGGEDWITIPAYITGVTNPIFETSGSSDLLMYIEIGRVVVSKDIHTSFPPTMTPPAIVPLVSRVGTIRAGSSAASEEEMAQTGLETERSPVRKQILQQSLTVWITCAIHRICDAARATRVEYEEIAAGSTELSYPGAPYVDGSLGSGIVFPDEAAVFKESAGNASWIKGWRRSKSYQYYTTDDLTEGAHRISRSLKIRFEGSIFCTSSRLCLMKIVPDAEVELMVRGIADYMQSYEQVVEGCPFVSRADTARSEWCIWTAPGILVREATVDIFNELLSGNSVHFRRHAPQGLTSRFFMQQAHAREGRMTDGLTTSVPPPPFVSRTLFELNLYTGHVHTGARMLLVENDLAHMPEQTPLVGMGSLMSIGPDVRR